MFRSAEDIDIDWLQNNHSRIYYFGLGFVQLKIDETWRLHFYTPELPAITEGIHNHRYNFTSRVLSGMIVNRRYDIVDGTTHILSNESCNPDIEAPGIVQPCGVELIAADVIKTWESYSMLDTVFHSVEARRCITLLERGPYAKEFAQVVTPVDKEAVCPFSKKVSDNELWSIIRAEIAITRRAAPHLPTALPHLHPVRSEPRTLR